jgi:hypothetical protein
MSGQRVCSAKLERRAEHDPEKWKPVFQHIMLKRTDETMIMLRRLMI